MSSDASQVIDLANDLTAAGPKLIKPLLGTLNDMGEATAKEWRANAKETAGSHAKKYPATITHTARGTFRGAVEVSIGPEARGQGMLGEILENGSATSGAHLDGARAVGTYERRIETALDTAITYLIP